MGKAALEGLEGIVKVEKGFRGLKEVNTVYFNPEVISVEKMEKRLKNEGTYIGTIR